MRHFILVIILTTLVCAFSPTPAKAEPNEIIEVPVIVNIHDKANFDPNKVPGMIDRLNKIFKQADIKFVFVPPPRTGIKVGNGDGKLDQDERNEARKKGYKELKDLKDNKGKKKYKGVKINICVEPVDGDPCTVGQALHRSRVILISPDKDGDANKTAATAGHEFGHAMTICGDRSDPNDQGHNPDPNYLMHELITGGTKLTPEDVNEIRKQAKKWGTVITPKSTNTETDKQTAGNGKIQKMVAAGGQIDSFFDVYVEIGDPCLFDPNEPLFHYADIGEVILYCEEPFTMSPLIDVDFILNGPLPTDRVAHATYRLDIDYDPLIPGAERYLQFDVICSPGVDPAITAEAFESGGILLGPIPDVEINFDPQLDEAPTKERYNNSVSAKLPSDFFEPGSDPFDGIIYCSMSSTVDSDYLLPPGMVLADEVDSFELALENPLSEPAITVSRAYKYTPEGEHWIFGGGFVPTEIVQLHIVPESETGPAIDVSAVADADGDFQVELLDIIGTAHGNYSIAAVGTPDVDGAVLYATGYFADKHLAGDLDSDGDVDLSDFVVFADEWLDEIDTP